MSDSQSGDHGFESRTDYFMSRMGIGYQTNYSEINSPLAGISDPNHMLIFYVILPNDKDDCDKHFRS